MPACPIHSTESIEKMDLSKFFTTPEKIVAKELGMSLTSLKKLCRQKGISRWPYRKVERFRCSWLVMIILMRFLNLFIFL